MNTLLTLLAAPLVVAASACSLPAVQQALPTKAAPPAPFTTDVAACSSTPVPGVGDVVTFMHEDAITCDVRPPQVLNIVFGDSSYQHWGSDASVRWAASECDDMGGRQVWVQNPYRLICEHVDF